MNNLPHQKLCEIITHYGQSICDEPRRCEALLRDFCRGEHRREISVLVGALKEQVPSTLLSSQNSVPRELLLSRLTKQLYENLALDGDAAKWAVESWALALGVITHAEIENSKPEPATHFEKVSTAVENLTAKQIDTKTHSNAGSLPESTPHSQQSFPQTYAPPAETSTPAVTYVQPSPPVSPSSNARDWQKAAMIGSLIGAAVLIGFIATRTPQTIGSNSGSSTTTPETPSPVVPSGAITIEPSPADTSTYSPPPLSPSSPSITRQEAVDLIYRWLQAKQQIFYPPFNRELVGELTTGSLYSHFTEPDGEIDWLINNNAYFQYGVRKVDSVKRFASYGNEAIIELIVLEDRTLYVNGKIDTSKTYFKKLRAVYSLKLVNSQWKIADIKF